MLMLVESYVDLRLDVRIHAFCFCCAALVSRFSSCTEMPSKRCSRVWISVMVDAFNECVEQQ